MRSGNFGEKKRWKVEFDWSKSVWGDLHKNDFRENRREVFSFFYDFTMDCTLASLIDLIETYPS